MSEVDRYLDEMFDRLAGTGAAGRRALTETEDHLRAAASDGTAQGLSAAQAEQQAVARFGPPARIAAQLRRAHRGARLSSAFSGVWLLAGLALVALGISYLISALGIAVLLRMHPEDLAACPELVRGPFIEGPCSNSVPIMQGDAVAGVVVLLFGVTALLGRRLAMRFAGLAPVARRFPLLAAFLFALAGLVLFAGPPFFGTPSAAGLFGVRQGPGLRLHVIVSGVAVVATMVTAVWGLALTLRRRYLRGTGGVPASSA